SSDFQPVCRGTLVCRKRSSGAAAGAAVALLSTPPETRRAARLNVFLGGMSYSAVPHGVSGVGCFLSLGPWGGVRRRCGRRAVGGDRVRRSAAATLDACRALLVDHLSYGGHWGNPPFARGAPSGWRLAARTEEQDESVPIRPSRRRCNRGTSATELERPRSFTGLLENPRATRKQHREGHNRTALSNVERPLRGSSENFSCRSHFSNYTSK
ncbi:unnamed protein product, partial [Pleuronectes platessa]